ncbi:MAG TPA: 30S ribosomal protein S3 [Candidatus Paceibacterota bacterium]|jgi:small subunit ribosomal protein S3|nr:30S ribosomal protein S3 [Candidatus Paceibacterota bacterium]HOH11274.1 30S ribosomal protein S3 [Candidatus Paceibacterota bacterium]HOY11233.1 30S ribosomal protein S3 [Candidatus Paceibacterota bacterium]HPB60514.1 30S ribosomal protein S3 [Candidatus Paceibacterota bacterium]HPI24459.1 30S ribosomal protein S3 [Candidatus Paceibacterota bacterium]
MTHSVHPYSHRIGIIRDWKSRWFGVGKNYREFLRADVCLREYLEKRLRGFYVADLQIERGVNQYKIIIKTSRPGMLIGRGGDGVVKLKNDIYAKLKKIGAKIPKELSVEIEEVKEPEAEAAIVAYMIAEGLEKRMPFRRVLKQTVEKVLSNKNVKGIKVVISGRLGGADMSRTEMIKRGQVPLQTFRADVDFAREKAYMYYGVIGIKVWIYRGEIFNKPNE